MCFWKIKRNSIVSPIVPAGSLMFAIIFLVFALTYLDEKKIAIPLFSVSAFLFIMACLLKMKFVPCSRSSKKPVAITSPPPASTVQLAEIKATPANARALPIDTTWHAAFHHSTLKKIIAAQRFDEQKEREKQQPQSMPISQLEVELDPQILGEKPHTPAKNMTPGHRDSFDEAATIQKAVNALY